MSSPDRPALTNDVEVTPEMIEAGQRAFAAYSVADIAEGWVSSAELVTVVYRQMAGTRPSEDRIEADPADC